MVWLMKVKWTLSLFVQKLLDNLTITYFFSRGRFNKGLLYLCQESEIHSLGFSAGEPASNLEQQIFIQVMHVTQILLSVHWQSA